MIKNKLARFYGSQCIHHLNHFNSGLSSSLINAYSNHKVTLNTLQILSGNYCQLQLHALTLQTNVFQSI